MRGPIVWCAAVALALAGCAGSPSATPITQAPTTQAPTTVPPTNVAPAPPATTSPPPTPTASGCSSWTPGAASIGPLTFEGACIDHSFAEAADAGTAINQPDFCPWYGEIRRDDDAGFYVSALSDPDSPGDVITFFVMHWYADPADAAAYGTPGTAEGISIGSSAADVLAAYPDAHAIDFDDIARGERSQLVTPTGPDTSYNFDIVDGVVTEISWGKSLDRGGPNGDLCAL